jgi:putative DNA primase/helicase
MSEQEIVAEFRDAMNAAGVPFSGPIEADDKRHRFRVDTDKRGKKNGWYILHTDGKPAGAFGTWKGVTCRWSAEGMAPLTKDERDRIRAASAEKRAAAAIVEAEQHAKSAARAVAMWDAATAATEHPYLARKGVASYGLRVGEWIKERQDGTTYVAAKDALLIPMRDEDKNTTSLQAVFATPVQMAGEDRDKDFVFGGRKRGCWFAIGKATQIDGQKTIAICEGYATGASIHEATGMGVVVAFDAKNLIVVAEAVRRLMPNARILIAADNDAWTTRADKVTPWNPGLEAGTQAARLCGGLLAAPAFVDTTDKPTDFNDLHAREGLEAVRHQVMGALSAPPAETGPPEEIPPWDGDAQFMEYVDPDDNGQEPPVAEPDSKDTEGFFRILGHDREQIHIYQYRKKLTISRKFCDWSESAMIVLAATHWWKRTFSPGGEFDKKAVKAAFEWIQREAEVKGYYDPDCRRGRGAWRDDGRIVYHFGDRLMIDGVLKPDLKIDSTGVYEQARKLRLPADEPMSNADGRKILEAAQGFAWSRPASALLWVGWCALAPMCGALTWRPHIWVTGGAGSGKSTILDLGHWMMNGCSIFAQGNSTEAGIRQTLQIDALPVFFDESEQNNEREGVRVQNIISLARQASTESAASTFKGTVGGAAVFFKIRSMFMFSSIGVNMKSQADFDRLSVLSLRPRREDPNAAASWKKLSGQLAALKADTELPARMMRRLIDLLPITLQNIEIFAQAAAEAFGSQREGDQYGALMAGAWSLVSTRLATLQDARDMIARYNWDDYLENSETEESTKAKGVLMARLVRASKGQDVSIYELVGVAAKQQVTGCNVQTEEADAILRRHGMMVKWGPTSRPEDAHLLVAYHSSELDRLMAGTPYAGDLKGQLLRVPLAKRSPGCENFSGNRSRAVMIPLTSVLYDLAPDPVTSERMMGDEVDDEIKF